MKFPIIICKSNTLILVGPEFFEDVGELCLNSRAIFYNVKSSGSAELHWILDRDANFYLLESQGFYKKYFLQKIGFNRKFEKYSITNPVKLSVQELTNKISSLTDNSPDYLDVADLRATLRELAPSSGLTSAHISNYFQSYGGHLDI